MSATDSWDWSWDAFLKDSHPYAERKREEVNAQYVIFAQTIMHFAMMGASDEQLKSLCKKGANVTMGDMADVYTANLREGDR